jgi:ABC-2 type transport system ATP-binding protein
MSREPAIEIERLSKRYPAAQGFAVHDLSLTVNSGEVYGFLGPNGAGKSTTIKTVMGFLRATSGTAHVLGVDCGTHDPTVKSQVGYLSGDMAIYPKMTGAQYLDYVGALLPPVSKTYRHELCRRLECTLNKPVGKLSRGNKQKIALVQAFMSQPSVLILDEPTSGLDPLMQEVFYDLVREAKTRGAAVFMSSHVLSEVQKTCDRVGIIKDGALIAEKDMAQLSEQAAQTYTITFAKKTPMTALRSVKGLRIISHDKQQVVLQLNGNLAPLFAVLAQHDTRKFDTAELDVEALFMHYYEGKS